MPENRQYLIEIPGMEGADMWDADRWERNKDRLLADHKDTNVFEVEAYNPWDEKENDQYLISMPGMEGSDVWDSERWQRNKEAFMKENPQAVVERVRYVDYWGDAAKQNRERRKELDQPDAERDARLAQIGYFDDLSGEQKTFDMNSPAMLGLKPLSSAVKQNSVSGATEYLDPKVAEFYANDTAYTDRLAEKARLDAEYESNPSVIAQREYEAELARYAAKLEEEIKSDMESDIDTGKFARGFARKNMPGTATAYATSGSLSKDTIGESLENEKYERYSTAVKLLEKAKIARNVAGKGFGGAVIDWAKEGFMDKTTQSDVEAYNEIGNILSRIEKEVGSLKAENITEEVFDKYLSKDEQALIKAFFEYNSAMAEAQQDMSGWYKGGKIFAESVPFMLEFLATGGLYKAAGRASTRGLEKALVKWITKSTGKSVASVGRKVLGSNAIGFARALAGTGARTLLSPGTYDRMAEASIEIDDEGHLHRAKNAAIGFADMYVENLSEISGGLIGKGLGYLGKGAGSLAKTLGGAPLAKFGSWLGDQKLVQGLVKGWSAAAPKLERLGFHGLPEEIGEEFIGNTIREFGIQPGALEEMVSDDNFGAMLIGFAPMTLLGAAGGAISIGVVNAKASKLGEELRQMFSNHHDTKEIDSIMQSLSGATTAKEIKEMLKPMEASVMDALSRGMITREQAIEEIEMLYQYGGFIAQNNALLFGQQARENELATAKRAEMADRYGRFWQQDETETVEVATLNNGNTVFVTSAPAEDGKITIVDAVTGKKGFANTSDIVTREVDGEQIQATNKMSMAAFLNGQIAMQRKTEEETRMANERNAQIDALRAQVTPGTRINLGTEGSPIYVFAKKVGADGVTVVDETGMETRLGWDQTADALGQPIIVETDQQKLDAEISARLQRLAERRMQSRVAPATQTATEEAAQETAEAVAQEQKHIPMNEDGTVNEAAFWMQDPEGYVQWNDEQNKDGGQDSLRQIAIAKQELIALLADVATGQNTSNPTMRKAAEKEVAIIQDKIAQLEAMEQRYAETLVESVKQTAATPTASMNEEQLEQMDAQYQGILSMTRVPSERVRVMQEYLNKLAEGSVQVVLLTKQNYEEQMKADNLPEVMIKRVRKEVEAGRAVAGFMAAGKVYLMNEGVSSINEARVTYIHERQHTFNKKNPELLKRFVDALESREKALEILKTFVGEGGMSVYESLTTDALADEILAYSMEIAYTTEEFSVDLQAKGIPSEVISIITEINDEQRKDQSLSHARRRRGRITNDNVPGAGSVQENGRDLGQISGGVLESEATRPSGSGGRGTQTGEGAEPGAEVISDGEAENNAAAAQGEGDGLHDDGTAGGGQAEDAGDTEQVSGGSLGLQGAGPYDGGAQGDNGPAGDVEPESLLDETGFEVDEGNEDVRFSVRYLPTPDQREGIIDSIVAVTGRTRDEAERWLDSELSLASIVLNDKEYLDYAPDAKYKAIKDNSDYPQGTVDFNNICRKRKDFTRMYTRLQRSYPNRIFTAEDLADIRTVMSEDGLTVACGLCYVEDRRQKLGEVANAFIEDLQDGFRNYAKKNATKKANAAQFVVLVSGDTYVPSIYDLITLEGSDKLYEEHRGIWEAFGAYNRARGQQTQNTFQGYAEYKREILTWSDAKVKKVNSLGGLRIFSYSDFEAHHLLDIIQIIIDCAARGVMIQGYTKVPEFARVVEKTGIKLNRSLIPLGDTGIVDGKLAYDPVEGIDINDPNFLESNDNVGNILIGINDEQIRIAMADPFIHYIIPYHARQAGNIRAKLNVGAWTNYIDTQNERKMSDGKRVEKNINIYTDVLNESITNDREFVEKYLEVCREKGYIPKFDQFLDKDAEGNYVYTPGYYKFLVDFKLFDEQGNILPQKPVIAEFDDAFNAQILNDYSREERETTGAAMNSTYDKIVETLDLGEPTEGEDVRFKIGEGPIDLIDEARKANASDIAFRFVGEKAAQRTDAIVGSAQMISALHTAQQMERQLNPKWFEKKNAEALRIKMATGWEKGVDGLWRYETPDFTYKGKPDGRKEFMLPELIEDDALFIQYPELKDARVVFADLGDNVSGKASIDRGSILIEIHERLYRAVNPAWTEAMERFRNEKPEAAKRIGSGNALIEDTYDLNDYVGNLEQYTDQFGGRETMAHEIQHVIQEIEGFALGGGAETFDTHDPQAAQLYGRFKDEVDEVNRLAEESQKIQQKIGLARFVGNTSMEQSLQAQAQQIANEYAIHYVNYQDLERILAGFGILGEDGYERLAGEVESDNVVRRLDMTPEERMQSLIADTQKMDHASQIILRNNLMVDFTEYMLSFRITPEQDKAYMDAVEAGDMETALRMVVEAARLAMPNTKVVDKYGNPKIVMHLSSDEFTKFGEDINTNVVSSLGFFTDELEGLQDYYDKFFPEGFAYKCFLNFENPKVVDFKGQPYWSYKDESTGEELTTDLIAARTKREGKHDGLIMLNVDDELAGNIGDVINDFVPFIPSQIKSAEPVTYDDEGNVIPLSQRFNPENEDIRFRMSNENQAIFVSNAAKAVEEIKQEKATPEQWLKMIEKNGGLKAGEDKWMGLSDWLKASDKKTLTKQEVLDFIKENMIQIEDVHYSRDVEDDAASQHDFLEQRVDKRYKEILNDLQDIEDYDDRRLEAFKQFQKELGEYAEFVDLERYGVYLTFPYEDLDKHIDMAKAFGVEVNLDNPIQETRRAYTTGGLENLHEIALTVPTIERWNVSDYLHFGDAGDGRAVAWIRFGDTQIIEEGSLMEYEPKNDVERKIKDYIEMGMNRWGYPFEECVGYAYNQITDAPQESVGWTEEAVTAVAEGMRGKARRRKVLVIDEIQSKRHQEGREKGYKKSKAEIEQYLSDNGYEVKEDGNFYNFYKNGELERRIAKGLMHNSMDKAKRFYVAALNKDESYNSGIPDAPFDKNWHELAMKRMLRYAAENGYDAIAWTKGEQQNERYNLVREIDELFIWDKGDGKTQVSYGYGGNTIKESPILKNREELEKIVGKEIADDFYSKNGRKQLQKYNLYEAPKKLRPKTIGGEGMRGFYDKMLPAFMNKYGKKWGVKVEDIELPNLEKAGQSMHSIPVTEEMKASVMEGQVMFRTTEITPEVRDEMDVISATAIINGNYLKAPNGADTKLTAEQWAMVRTKNFLRWFGDWINDPENASKVVDENGEPKVVYHGSRDFGFTVFTTDPKTQNLGSHFGTAEAAGIFANEDNIYSVFLNITNPYSSSVEDFWTDDEQTYAFVVAELASKLATEGNKEAAKIYDEIVALYPMAKDEKTWLEWFETGEGREYMYPHDLHTPLRRLLEIGGYDGWMYVNFVEDAGSISWVALSPSQIKSATDNTGEFSEEEGDIRFSIRTKPAPKKTGIGYKVFYLKDGKLYPPMVANLGGVDTPVMVWLDADAAPIAGKSKTGRTQVKAGGKGTQGGSGTLAYRPGWHLGEIPYAIQFNRKDENGGRTLFPADFVWAEVEYANDVDYQDEAMSYGMNANGKFQHSLAGLPKLPTDGSYRYRTNPNPETDPWIITGAMKVNRILTPSEVDQMVRDAGREPQRRQEGAVTDEQIKALNKELGLTKESSFSVNENPTEAQKEAGNYKMGHLNLDGYRITIENPKGSVRRGTDSKGNAWENTLNNDYGYIRGTEGVDGDHIDVYLSDNPSESNVFVIDQVNPETREFDEHKVMYGFNSAEEAREAYLANFSEGWNGLGTITEVSKDEFKKWIQSSHRKTKPFSEYKSVNAISSQSEGMEDEVMLRVTGTPTDEVVASGLSLSPTQTADLAGNIFAALPESARADVTASLNGDILGLQDAIMQIPARLAMKENWDEADKELASVVREKVQDIVDSKGATSRPLTTKEALWMLHNTGNSYDLISAATDAIVARNLGFDPESIRRRKDVHDYIRFRAGSQGAIDAATDMYNYETSLWTERVKESWSDMNLSVVALQNAISQASGMPIEPWENVVYALNRLSSKSYADKQKYLRDYLMPLWDTILDIVKHDHVSIEDIERYMMLKHALERNEIFAKRDAKEFYRGMYDEVARRMKSQSHAEKVVALSEAKKALADIDAQIATATGTKLQKLKDERVNAQYKVDVADLALRGDEKQNEKDLQDYYDNIDAGTDPKYREFREKDYGGLTSMYTTYVNVRRSNYKSEEAYQQAVLANQQPIYDNVADMESAARMEVDNFENRVYMHKALWDKVNAATKETLRHQYESGMITVEQYEAVRDMFKHYVPLRGFADNTAEDMYSYYMNNSSNGFSMPIIGAKGRKTRAESPLGWIGTMAESAIQADNKNEAKMCLYYAVLRRPDQNLLSITDTWFEYSHTENGKKVYKPAYPPKTDRVLNADELRQHMEDWEKDMKSKQAQGKAFKGTQAVNLRGSVIFQDSKQEKEHIIRVKVAGKDYSILINGNPRAAQAINGLLNPDANVSPVIEWLGWARRGLSSLLTSFSPLFWVANYQRDLLSSTMRTSEAYGWGEAMRYLANRRRAWRVASYIYKHPNGTLGNSYYENLYKEFAENGGITGYTALTSNKEYEKLLADYANEASRPSVIKWAKDVFGKFMSFGEAIEQVSRFAAFITARESGKPIEEAINAAKEVSVNFNRKGSAQSISRDELEKLRTKDGQKLNGVQKVAVIVLSAMPSWLKELYFFFNASVQAISSSIKLATKSPGTAAAWAGAYFGMSIAMAWINYLLGDDDDDEYLDLPDYLRHSTVLIKVSDGYYIKWSIPQEMRPFYAWGDMIVSKMMGKMPHKNLGKEMALAAAQWLPVNPFEAEDPLLSLVPDVVSPIAEAVANKTSFGGKIYDDMAFKSEGTVQDIPAYRKATDKTGKVYVELSEILNAISGGDEVQKGWANINPAALEHLVEGYGGGIYDFAKMMVTFPGLVIDAATGEKEMEIKNIPFVNKVVMSVDETNMYSHTNDAFYHYKGIAESAKRIEKEYAESDDPSRAEAYREEEDWRIYLLYKQYEKDFKDVKERLDNAVDDTETDLLKQEQNVLREMFLNDIAKGELPEITFEIREDIKRIEKDIKKIMKPADDANKERLERKKAGDVDGMVRAIERRDSLKDTPEYQRAEEISKEVKAIKKQLQELGTVERRSQRDSVIGELQRNYERLKERMSDEISQLP